MLATLISIIVVWYVASGKENTLLKIWGGTCLLVWILKEIGLR